MKFSLVVTSRNLVVLKRFLDSLERVNNDRLDIFLVFVNQTSDALNYVPGSFQMLEVMTAPCSLSVARNIGLKHVPVDTRYIGFPDDDCWYPKEILLQVSKLLDEHMGVCVNVFDPLRSMYYGNRPTKRLMINCYNIYYLPISVGIFVRFKSSASFDTDFGVGSKYGSGEETLFLINHYLDSRMIYAGDLRVYHEVASGLSWSKELSYSIGFGKMLSSSARKNSTFSRIFFWRLFGSSILGSFIKLRGFYLVRAFGLFKGYFL